MMTRSILRLLLLPVALLPATAVSAATITPNSTIDVVQAADGKCTLREAVANANANSDTTGGDCAAGDGDDTVALDGRTYTLADGYLVVNGAGILTIAGPGTIDANNASRLLYVATGNTGVLTRITATRGQDEEGGAVLNDGSLHIRQSTISASRADKGGGIFNTGELVLDSSTLSGNDANSGGAVYNRGTLTVRTSTISGNSSVSASGIWNNNGAFMRLLSSTVAFNSGSAIGNFDGTAELKSSIIAGNDTDCESSVDPVSLNFNVFGSAGCGSLQANDVIADALLGPLQDNGGPTLTHAVAPGSPAVDRTPVTDPTCTASNDQRGFVRSVGTRCDSGALELERLWTVNSLADTNVCDATTCTLRGAITAALAIPDADLIQFADSLAGGTIALDSTLPEVEGPDGPLTIDGRSLGITLDGQEHDRHIIARNGAVLSLKGLTLENGAGDGGGAILSVSASVHVDHCTFRNNRATSHGGAIESQSGGDLRIVASTFIGNQADTAGAIRQLGGSIDIFNSTFSGNRAVGSLNQNTGAIGVAMATATFTNTSFVDNSAGGVSGALTVGSGDLRLRNVLMAGNTASGVADTCYIAPAATIVDDGGNLASDGSCGATIAVVTGLRDTIGDLANNGGPTPTHAPRPGSAVIDAGMATGCPANDQRGIARPQDGDRSGTAMCDAGAVELIDLAPTLSAPSPQSTFEDQPIGPIEFVIGDDHLAPEALTVWAESSDQTVVPDANVVLGGSGATRTVAVTPGADASGTTTITLHVSDGVSAIEASFPVVVTAANDAPSFTPGGGVSVDEDAGPQSVPAWATNLTAGPANESDQTLTFQIAGNNNPALFSVGPAIDAATGTLTYIPAAHAHGTATVTVVLHDSGGIVDGGVDASAPVAFTIAVTPVNDAPSFVAGAGQHVAEDAGPQSVAAWATNLSAGPTNESGQTLAFEIVGNTNTSLFAAGPSVSANGTLTYTLAADAHGTATVSVQLRDDGGTANGGHDVSEPASFSVTVASANDAPTISAIGALTMAQNSTSTIAFSIDDIDDAPETLTTTATSSNTTLVSATGVVLAGNGRDRTVTITPLADRIGETTITLSVGDGSASTSTTFLVRVQDTTRPDAPVNLVASTRGNTVTLTWRAAGTAPAHYIVETSRTPFGTSLPIAVVSGDLATFAAPLAQGTYFFRVRGQNSAGLSNPSNEAAATVGVAGTPSAPTALRASIDGNRVTLAWQRPAAEPTPTTYTVDLGRAPGASDIGSVNLGSAATTIAASLADGTYVARIRAYTGAAVGAASNDVSFTIGDTPCVAEPTAPVMLTPSVAPDLVTLTWLAPASGATSAYRLVAGSAPGLADLAVFDTASNATAVRVATPPAGTYYVYTVAMNACGLSAASNVVPVTVTPAMPLPGAPRQLTVAVDGSTVAFSWTAPGSGATPFYYLLEAGSAPGLADYAVLPIYAASTAVTVPGVPRARYYLRVRAITMGGAGVASNEVIVDVP